MKISKIGMPTLIECRTIEENLDLCRSLGLNLLELNMNLPLAQLKELKKLDFPDDIDFTLHLPEELNPWDINEKIKTSYLDYLKETIDFSLEKGISKLTMHMNRGVYFTLPEKKVYLFEEFNGDFMDDTIFFCEMVKRAIGESNLTINIENTGIYKIKFFEEALNRILKNHCFNLTWDIGHDHRSGWTDSQFILPHIDRVTHLHLHDGLGKKNHLPLGSGEIDVLGLLQRFPSVPSCVLETKTSAGLRESVEYLRGREMMIEI